MSPAEIALAEQGGPTFADLCDQVRRARRLQYKLLQKVETAKQHVKDAEEAEQAAVEACDVAQCALDRFIDRECEVDG